MIISDQEDGNRSIVASHPAGKAFVVAQDGVQYFPTEVDAISTWAEQVKRFRGIVEKANAIALLSPRVRNIDKTTVQAQRRRVPQARRPASTGQQI